MGMWMNTTVQILGVGVSKSEKMEWFVDNKSKLLTAKCLSLICPSWLRPNAHGFLKTYRRLESSYLFQSARVGVDITAKCLPWPVLPDCQDRENSVRYFRSSRPCRMNVLIVLTKRSTLQWQKIYH